jgi:hypothetical protein
MNGSSLSIQDREIDPVEVEPVAGCPNHGANASRAEINLPNWFGQTGRVRQNRMSGRVGRQVHAVMFDVGIDQIKKRAIGGISARQTIG